MQPILAICIPCYNKAKYLDGLIKLLEPLADIAEVCVFDNGSTDLPNGFIDPNEYKIAVRLLRADVRSPIDHSWLTALSLGKAPFKKLQLADDVPDAENIREGLNHLIQCHGKNYVFSPQKNLYTDVAQRDIDYQEKVSESTNILRAEIATLMSEKERAKFVFSKFGFGNTLGDINGLIFRSEALDGLTAISQSYYGFLTHPDAELFLHLLANNQATHYPKPFSYYRSSAESPTNMISKNFDFNLRVYRIPAVTHALALLMDPGLRVLRANVSAFNYWKFVIRFLRRLLREIRELRHK